MSSSISYILSLHPPDTPIVVMDHSMGDIVATSLLPSPSPSLPSPRRCLTDSLQHNSSAASLPSMTTTRPCLRLPTCPCCCCVHAIQFPSFAGSLLLVNAPFPAQADVQKPEYDPKVTPECLSTSDKLLEASNVRTFTVAMPWRADTVSPQIVLPRLRRLYTIIHNPCGDVRGSSFRVL